MVGAHDGAPLAVAAQNRVTAKGVWRCRETGIDPDGQKRHPDELSERMNWLEQQPWGKRRVHIIDREADSAAHMRQPSGGGGCASRRFRRCASRGSRWESGKWRNGWHFMRRGDSNARAGSPCSGSPVRR